MPFRITARRADGVRRPVPDRPMRRLVLVPPRRRGADARRPGRVADPDHRPAAGDRRAGPGPGKGARRVAGVRPPRPPVLEPRASAWRPPGDRLRAGREGDRVRPLRRRARRVVPESLRPQADRRRGELRPAGAPALPLVARGRDRPSRPPRPVRGRGRLPEGGHAGPAALPVPARKGPHRGGARRQLGPVADVRPRGRSLRARDRDGAAERAGSGSGPEAGQEPEPQDVRIRPSLIEGISL